MKWDYHLFLNQERILEKNTPNIVFSVIGYFISLR